MRDDLLKHRLEERCRRNLIDDSINIRGLKKICRRSGGSRSGSRSKANVSTGKKIAVIGGGPAGLTAAYFLGQMGHKVTYLRTSSSGRNASLRYPELPFPERPSG